MKTQEETTKAPSSSDELRIAVEPRPLKVPRCRFCHKSMNSGLFLTVAVTNLERTEVLAHGPITCSVECLVEHQRKGMPE